MKKKQSYMPKYIAEKALAEYRKIEKLFNANKGKTIAALFEVFREHFYVFNFDGEFFDISPVFVIATIYEVNGEPNLMSKFDVFCQNGMQCDYTVEELERIINE